MSVVVEVVCCSAEDCSAAQDVGADRIELCAAIELGGLTPSVGLYEVCRENCALPIVVMIRPRPGGFEYSPSERAVMSRDLEAFMAIGADTFALGCLQSGRVDSTFFLPPGPTYTFHRAFDAIREASHPIKDVYQAGYSRVLTSGGTPTALEGARRISELVAEANGSIEIIAAGGIRAGNVSQVVKQTGCTAVHLGAFVPADTSSYQGVTALRLDTNTIKQVVRQLKG